MESRPRIAVLFRGYHYYTHMPPNRRPSTNPPTAFDFRRPWPHIRETVMEPLSARGNVSVFVSTYVSDHETQAALETALRPRRILYHGHDANLKQTDILADGLHLILGDNVVYDEVWIVRFDVMYKIPMSSWPAAVFDAQGVVVPFRERVTHKLLSDVLIVVRGSWYVLLKVWSAVDALAKRNMIDMHTIADSYETMRIPYTTMYDEGYNSNTSTGDPVNPLFVLYGRYYRGKDAPTGFQA